MHLTVGDQTLSYHLPMELSISSNAYNVNAMGCVEQKRVTKVVWDEEKKDILIQVSRSEDAVNLLTVATDLITYELEGAIKRFTSYLSHNAQCMNKTSVVMNEPFIRDPSWFGRKCQNKKKRNKERFK